MIGKELLGKYVIMNREGYYVRIDDMYTDVLELAKLFNTYKEARSDIDDNGGAIDEEEVVMVIESNRTRVVTSGTEPLSELLQAYQKYCGNTDIKHVCENFKAGWLAAKAE